MPGPTEKLINAARTQKTHRHETLDPLDQIKKSSSRPNLENQGTSI